MKIILFLIPLILIAGCTQNTPVVVVIQENTTNITVIDTIEKNCLEYSIKYYCEHPEVKIPRVHCENFVNTPSHVLIEFPNGTWYESTRDVIVDRENYPCNHTGYLEDWFIEAMVEKYCD